MASSTAGGEHVPRLPLRTVGPYQLRSQLGHGARGPVYAARVPGNSAPFALELLPELPSGEVDELRRRLQEVARLDHPGLVRPVDVGVDGGRLYVVTEHDERDGGLRERLSRAGPLPPDEAARVVAGAAEALAAAHEAGILHLGLRPGAIVLGPGGAVRVRELGLAAGGDEVPRVERLAYRAPELLRGEDPGPAADVYGLGALLYELLSGLPPFSGHAADSMRRQVLDGHPPPPSDQAPELDRGLELLCLKAMDLDPRQRPAGAAALARELRRAAGGSRAAGSRLLLPLVALVWALTLAIPAALAWRARGDAAALRASQADLQGELDGVRAAAAAEAERLGAELTAAAAARDARAAELAEARQREAQLREQLAAVARERDQAQATLGQAYAALGEVRGETAWTLDALDHQLEGAGALARVHLRRHRGRFAEAAKLARTLREGGDERWELRAAEAYCLSALGRTAEAQGLVRRWAEAAPPGSPEALWMTIAAQEFAGQPPTGELLPALREAVAAEPRNPFLRLGLARTLAVRARQALAARGRGGVDEATLQAVWNEGWAAVDAAVQVCAPDPDALALRAGLATQAGHALQQPELLQRALGDLRLARAIRPMPHLWRESAVLTLQLGNPYLAQAELRTASRLAEQSGSPDEQIRTRMWLGNAAAMLGQEQVAVQRWVEAVGAAGRPGSGFMAMGPYLQRVSPEARQAVLTAVPAPLREQLEAYLRDAGGG